jgi:hypothetical protein
LQLKSLLVAKGSAKIGAESTVGADWTCLRLVVLRWVYFRFFATRVNKPENDDPSLLHRAGNVFDVWAPLRSVGKA